MNDEKVKKQVDLKGFITEITATALTMFDHNQQNIIIKELLHSVLENREVYIKESVDKIETLKTLTNELPKL